MTERKPIDSRDRDERLLESTILEYKTQPHTPELIERTWETLWQEWGRRTGLVVNIGGPDYNAEEIEELEDEGRALLYVPKEVSTQETRPLLYLAFPETQDDSIDQYHRLGNRIENLVEQFGWITVEVDRDAPRYDRLDELSKTFVERGWEGQTLNTYIIGSEFIKLVKGYYFDEYIPSCSWILLSRDQETGRMFHVNFTKDGHLRILRHYPTTDYEGYVGFRSAKRKGVATNVGILGKSLNIINSQSIEAFHSPERMRVIEHFRRLGVLEDIDASGRTPNKIHRDITRRLEDK